MNYTEEKIKYRESDYIYGTARIRTLEKYLMSDALIVRMLDCPDFDSCVSILKEAKIPIDSSDIEPSLTLILQNAFDELDGAINDKRITALVHYPYDAHNIKAAIKCDIRSVDATPLLSPLGTVSPEKIKDMPKTGIWSAFPENMRKAAIEAIDTFSANRDPQMLDSVIDKACFADMKKSAEAVSDEFFAKWVKVRCDTVNILSCIRIMRMAGEESDTEYLERMLIPYGSLSHRMFADCLGDGEAALWKALYASDYAPLISRIEESGKYSLTDIERCCDNYCISVLKDQKPLLSSAGAICAYGIAVEYMCKNIRIILCAKKNGDSNETIKERLRICYV